MKVRQLVKMKTTMWKYAVMERSANLILKQNLTEIAENLGILDLNVGLRCLVVVLSFIKVWCPFGRAIYNFMLDEHGKEGYTEVIPLYCK